MRTLRSIMRAARVSPAVLLAAALALLFLGQAFFSVMGQDPTTDESEYFGVGRSILTTYRWTDSAARLHPPLSYYANSLPLLFMPAALVRPAGNTLLLCRTVSLVVFGLPMLACIFLWARELYGSRAAVLALAITAVSPNLLAHAGLITQDLAVTSTGFVAIYLLWRFWRRPGHARFFAWSIALGLALLSKGSAVLFVLAAVLISLVEIVKRRDARLLLRLAAALALAVLVVHAGYGFKGVWDAANKASLVLRTPPTQPARTLAWAAALLLPLPYLESMATQAKVALTGWPAFLMGEVSRTGWAHYYAVAFLIKVPLALQMMLVAALAGLCRARSGWRNELWLLAPPIIFFAFFSFVDRVDIGLRYVLPAFPFLIVFTSRLARPRGAVGPRRQWMARAVIAALLLWQGISVARISPQYLAYFNELIGGPRHGYEYLVDSNLDWGQNLSRVRERASSEGLLVEPDVLLPADRVVVSANRLQGIYERQRYRLLREEYRPVGHIGYNWLVFDLARNRRYPVEDMVPVLSGPGWFVKAKADGSEFEPVRLLDGDPDTDFVATKAFPGTRARLMCPPGREEVSGYIYRHRFALARSPARAVLHFAARDRYSISINGNTVHTICEHRGNYSPQEYRVGRFLRAGDNEIEIGTRRCACQSSDGVFVEMRVAQRPRHSDR